MSGLVFRSGVMSTSTTYAVVSGAAILAVFAFVWSSQRVKSKIPLPPSPEAEWLVGHLRSMPPGSDHKVYAQIGAQLKSQSPSNNRIFR